MTRLVVVVDVVLSPSIKSKKGKKKNIFLVSSSFLVERTLNISNDSPIHPDVYAGE